MEQCHGQESTNTLEEHSVMCDSISIVLFYCAIKFCSRVLTILLENLLVDPIANLNCSMHFTGRKTKELQANSTEHSDANIFPIPNMHASCIVERNRAKINRGFVCTF